ncbi:beta1,4-N-acetylgalactosaminyltransferase B isoform X1 [Leptinotarsa decemlineata]|uniref:beta1,4-N-acetylgalactosaminyltransferase B isoform X1 n=1 Tax=Leptinotarsa decemlineata TaxID=7539 RepID=UPI003D30B9A8
MLKNCIGVITIIILFIAVYFPSRHARRYDYIVLKNILNELDFRKTENVDFKLQNCSYRDMIMKNEDVIALPEQIRFRKPLPGGEYKPIDCAPLVKSALIIPYRQRQKQLEFFLKYMHSFLQNQSIHYRIFIVEQNDTLAFNRAKMMNYGAKVAMKFQYHCLILHDVDLIPMNTANIYGCTKSPRHMSSSLDTFRYNLPYLTLFGGAVAISSEQFQKVNGMSNRFYGWGGEDDDFYRRLVNSNLDPCRFSPQVSKYVMLPHKKEKASKDRFQILQENNDEQWYDGLNSLSNKYLVKIEELYTHIITS